VNDLCESFEVSLGPWLGAGRGVSSLGPAAVAHGPQTRLVTRRVSARAQRWCRGVCCRPFKACDMRPLSRTHPCPAIFFPNLVDVPCDRGPAAAAARPPSEQRLRGAPAIATRSAADRHPHNKCGDHPACYTAALDLTQPLEAPATGFRGRCGRMEARSTVHGGAVQLRQRHQGELYDRVGDGDGDDRGLLSIMCFDDVDNCRARPLTFASATFAALPLNDRSTESLAPTAVRRAATSTPRPTTPTGSPTTAPARGRAPPS